MSRSRIKRVGTVVVLIAVGAVTATLVAHGARGPRPPRAVALGTAVVQRGDLVQTRHFRGHLSFPSRGSVHLSGSGTVTSLPRMGQVLTDGAPAAGVDDRPIAVLFGSAPLYRTLGAVSPAGAQLAVAAARAELLTAQAASPGVAGGGSADSAGTSDPAPSPGRAARIASAQVGVEQARGRLRAAQDALARAQAPQRGPDVALVARDLSTLGYLQTVSDVWTPTLQAAVSRWQAHIGAVPSGHLSAAGVLVLAGAARVSGVQGQLGDAPSLVTISLSAPSRLASFVLKGAVPAALKRGRRVSLSASGVTVTGRVRRLRTGARSTLVQVTFPRSSALNRAPSAVVSMSVTVADQRNVLTVPTQALLALTSGGYALQLPGGRLLAVHTGAEQNGDIEVSGPGVSQGLRVVSAS